MRVLRTSLGPKHPMQTSHRCLTIHGRRLNAIFRQPIALRILAYSDSRSQRTRDQIGFAIYYECLALEAKSEFSFLTRNLMVARSPQA
jgi:hypothetical protein